LRNKDQRFDNFVEKYEVTEIPDRHPSIFEPKMLLFGIALALLGVIIGLELQTHVGITPNTSIIGAIVAIAVSRIPISMVVSFRDVARQNLMQTVISGATFGGANAILVPVGILWLIGQPGLVPAMLIGASLGLVIDATILYNVFDSKIYPASGIWPQGIAAAECIIAGDRGGKRARLLGLGGIVGAAGKLVGIPTEIFGVAWIGNIWAMSALGAGLLFRGYSVVLFGRDINEIYLPHGIMIGAGIVALVQIVYSIFSNNRNTAEKEAVTRPGRHFAFGIGGGYVAFVAAAVVLAVITGLYSGMPPGRLLFFVTFAGCAALFSELVVGIAAMHSGWFPAFATTLIFLVVGMLLGFSGIPLAVLVGFTAATGPAFADMGYDLKSGWILRGGGRYPEYERQGRRQQYFAELLGFIIAITVAAFTYKFYFSAGHFPPVDRVFASTILAGTDSGIARYLLIWAVPGAVIQLLGGRSRQIGILFATGLLILNVPAGWTVLIALVVRIWLIRKYGESVQSPMYVLAGGFIAGSALASFTTATLKLK